MAGREIAHGEVVIGVDLDKIGAQLRAAEAQFGQTMSAIDRMEAEAQVSVNTTRLKKDIAEAKRELLGLEKQKAQIDPELDTTEFDAQIAACKARIKELNQQKVEIGVKASQLRDANKELSTAEKRLKKITDTGEEYADSQRKLWKDQTAALQHEADMREKAAAEQRKLWQDQTAALRYEEQMLEKRHDLLREQALLQQRAIDMDEDRTRKQAAGYMNALRYEERLQAARDRAAEREQSDFRTMARLQQQAIDLDAKRPEQIAKTRIELGKLLTKQENLKTSMARTLGLSPEKDLELDKVNAQISRLRVNLRSLGGSEKGLKGVFDEDTSHRVRAMLTSLGSVRLQMGFFSATLRQSAAAFTALGPIIFGIMGQIVSLVGVLGTSLVGAFGVATAAAAGFGLTALGQFFILKPLVGELTDATKASTAYGDAVRKYGKGSTQAQGKLEQLNNTLGDIGPKARAAFISFGTIGDRWAKLTTGTRETFFSSMARGITAINKVLPMFAKESVKAFDASAAATDKWNSALSSPRSISNIQQMMSAFTTSLPAINAGLMSIGEMMANIGVSAGRYLPELSSGFSTWANNLLKSVGSGAGLDASMGRLIDHMQKLGGFLQASGSMIAAFFNSGANEGATLLQTLTSLSNEWKAWMQSASGQQSLAQFFQQANQIGSAFIGTIANIGVALFELSSALTPLSQGFVAVISAAAKFSAVLFSFSGARDAITAVGGALAGAFIGSKIVAAAQGVMALVGAIRALATASAVSSVAAAMNPWVAAFTVIGAGVAMFTLLNDKMNAAESSLAAVAAAAGAVKNAIAAMNGNDVSAAAAGVQRVAALQAEQVAQKALNVAIKEHGRGSQEVRQAEIALTQATVARQQASVQLNSALDASSKNYSDTIAKVEKQEEAINNSRAEAEKYVNEVTEAYNRNEVGADTVADAKRRLIVEENKHVRVLQRLDQLNNAQARSDLNSQRALLGRAAILKNVGAQWRALRTELSPKGQDAIAKIVDEDQAAQAIKLLGRLKDAGKLGRAQKILVNTADIDKAMAKLRALDQRTARQTRKQRVDVDISAAEAKQRQLRTNFQKNFKGGKVQVDANTAQADRKVRSVGKGAKVRVTADASDATSTINRLANRKIAPKKIRITGDTSAAVTSINKIQSTKLNDKRFSIRVDDGEAKNAKTFVDRIPANTTKRLTMAAEYSALQNAKNYLSSIQSKTVTLTINTVKTGSRASGGPVPGFAAGGSSIGPARSSLLERSQERANEKQNRGGVYKRPTLLVGEENRDEYVIASNPAYRSQNVKYLGAAASEFGYQLVSAAKGKSAAGYGRSRTPYDYIQSEISRLQSKSQGLDTTRQNNISAGRDPGVSLQSVLNPLEEALSPWYVRLAKNLRTRMTRAAKTANKNARSLPKLNAQMKSAKKQLAAVRASKAPKGLKGDARDKWQRKHDKELRAAEQAAERTKSRRDQAKSAVQTKGDSAGALWRESRTVANSRRDLRNQIQQLRDAENQRLNPDDPANGGTSNPIGIQMGAFDKDRYDFFNQFASNISSTPSQPPTGFAGGSQTPAFYSAGAPGGGPSFAFGGGSGNMGGVPAQTSASGPGGVTQNITITEAPADPHTFTRQLGWEARMAAY